MEIIATSLRIQQDRPGEPWNILVEHLDASGNAVSSYSGQRASLSAAMILAYQLKD